MCSFAQRLIVLLQRSNVTCDGLIRIPKVVQVTYPFQRLVERVLAARFKRSPQGAFTAILRHRLQEPWNFIKSIGARQIVLSDCDNPAATMTVSNVCILQEFKHIVSFCTRLQPNERYGSSFKQPLPHTQPSHGPVKNIRTVWFTALPRLATYWTTKKRVSSIFGMDRNHSITEMSCIVKGLVGWTILSHSAPRT